MAATPGPAPPPWGSSRPCAASGSPGGPRRLAGGRRRGGAAALGERIVGRARAWRSDHPRLGDVRGRGFMIGLEFMENGRPAPELVQRIVKAAVDRNLLILSCGLDENVIRLIPPLTLTEEEL